jgi:hypothetical protein
VLLLLPLLLLSLLLLLLLPPQLPGRDARRPRCGCAAGAAANVLD